MDNWILHKILVWIGSSLLSSSLFVMPSASQFQTKRNFALPLPGCILWQSGAHIQDLAAVNHFLCHLCILFLLDATLLTWTFYCQLQDDKLFPTFQEWLLCPPVLRKSGSRQMSLTAVLPRLTNMQRNVAANRNCHWRQKGGHCLSTVFSKTQLL